MTEENYRYAEDLAAGGIYRERATPAARPPLSRGRVLGGALLLLLGLACLAFLAVQLARDVSLWIFGTEVEADVVDAWAEPTGEASDGILTFQYYVRYRFATPRGQVITGTSTVSAGEWVGAGTSAQRAGVRWDGEADQSAPVYHEQSHVPVEGIGGLEQGGSIAVVYFPLYPQHNRLEESRLVPLLACSYLPLVLVGLAALLAGRHTLRPILYRLPRKPPA